MNECRIMTFPHLEVWDKLLIQLGRILDDARWNINNYSTTRVELCENIILTIQPLVHYATYLEISNLGMYIFILLVL